VGLLEAVISFIISEFPKKEFLAILNISCCLAKPRHQAEKADKVLLGAIFSINAFH